MPDGRSGRPLRIGLAAENGEWHRDRLREAFLRRGIEPVLFSLAEVEVVTGHGEPLRLPGFADKLPDGLLLRTISGGSFEATTLRLGVLHALVSAGVTVWNDPRAIERCVDKSMTSLLVSRSGLPTPPTFVVSTREAAAALVERCASREAPMVLKPLFGSQGKGLQLIADAAALPSADMVAGVYYLQQFVRRPGAGWRDYRVFVCAGEVVAGMVREGKQWITNVHQGGRPHPWSVSREAARLALGAAAAVDVAYSGIDLVEDADGGLLLLEVNSMPSWSALQTVTERDIAMTIVDAFLRTVEDARSAKADLGR